MANNGSYSFGNDTYFDSIYCINLKDRPDRWSQVKIELEKIGILDRVIRFDAVKNQNPAI